MTPLCFCLFYLFLISKLYVCMPECCSLSGVLEPFVLFYMFWPFDISLTHWSGFLERIHSDLHCVILECIIFYSLPALWAHTRVWMRMLLFLKVPGGSGSYVIWCLDKTLRCVWAVSRKTMSSVSKYYTASNNPSPHWEPCSSPFCSFLLWLHHLIVSNPAC